MAIPTDEEYALFQRQLELEKESGTAAESDKIKEKVDEDGTVYQWDEVQKAWFPKITQDFLANYQASYGSMREPITSPDGIVFNWDDERKHYFNDKGEKLPENGFLVDGVTYTYSIESSQWLANGAPIARQNQDQTYKDENGKIYFWNEAKKLWVTEEGMTFDPETGIYTDSTTGKVYDPVKMEWVNPKKAETKKVEKEGLIKTKRSEKKKAEWFEQKEDENLNIYIEGLPKTFTLEKFENLVKKYGIIKPDEKTGKPKIKLYTDKEGKPKGDGLCCYLAKESVDLALDILDGDTVEGHKLSVQPAKFELKGKFDASKKKKALKKRDKQAMAKQKEKLLGWGGMGMTSGAEEKQKRQRFEKVVVFRNCFTVDEMNRDPCLILRVKEDLRRISAPFGQTQKVNLFDGHPQGVCSVSFINHEGADRAIDSLNGKLFRGRTLDVSRWDGHTDFSIEETQAEINNRDSAWAEWLEGDEDE